MEAGPYGTACIDPASIVHRDYWEESLTRYETSATLSFSVPGYSSDTARVSYILYLTDPVMVVLRDYAAAHPDSVTPAVGGLEKVAAWYDPTRSTLRHPVLTRGHTRGWFLAEPGLLDAKGEGSFFLECRAGADGSECIRHLSVSGRSVEVIMSDADLQHWSQADAALHTALQSVLAPCIP
ncbi:MAG TPA: hypothetical protein VGO35_06105 [Gammaproteobacteria bacterium]|nr:hypothetical protein [Gammaproteobacteria bacterium]